MKFVIEIDIQDPSTKYIDTGYMLRQTENKLLHWAPLTSASTGTIKDYNGNNVGTWKFTNE